MGISSPLMRKNYMFVRILGGGAVAVQEGRVMLHVVNI